MKRHLNASVSKLLRRKNATTVRGMVLQTHVDSPLKRSLSNGPADGLGTSSKLTDLQALNKKAIAQIYGDSGDLLYHPYWR